MHQLTAIRYIERFAQQISTCFKIYHISFCLVFSLQGYKKEKKNEASEIFEQNQIIDLFHLFCVEYQNIFKPGKIRMCFFGQFRDLFQKIKKNKHLQL